MNFRSRELLDLAYLLPCQYQLDCCEGGNAGEPSHSNQPIHGKGMSIKAHDCFFVPACRSCHVEMDQGRRYNREEKRDIWNAAFFRTTLLLWQMGLIQVTK